MMLMILLERSVGQMCNFKQSFINILVISSAHPLWKIGAHWKQQSAALCFIMIWSGETFINSESYVQYTLLAIVIWFRLSHSNAQRPTMKRTTKKIAVAEKYQPNNYTMRINRRRYLVHTELQLHCAYIVYAHSNRRLPSGEINFIWICLNTLIQSHNECEHSNTLLLDLVSDYGSIVVWWLVSHIPLFGRMDTVLLGTFRLNFARRRCLFLSFSLFHQLNGTHNKTNGMRQWSVIPVGHKL